VPEVIALRANQGLRTCRMRNRLFLSSLIEETLASDNSEVAEYGRSKEEQIRGKPVEIAAYLAVPALNRVLREE
jgi:hypothetical protein